MRLHLARVLVLLLALISGLLQTPARAETLQLTVAEDKTTGYTRSAFKHWIDADKDGCDTRAEVLIDEAIEKPKIGPKCKLIGGKWISAYDGKTITNASQLDVDHLVPLAEAWRSGAWKWTAAQRQAYANDLDNSEALIAVIASSNRSKGDKDPSLWMPAKDQCVYIQNWVSIKGKYSLTADSNEAEKLDKYILDCGFSSSTFTNSQEVGIPSAPLMTQEDYQESGQDWVLVKMQSSSNEKLPNGYGKAFSIKSEESLIGLSQGQWKIRCFRQSWLNDKDSSSFENSAGGIFLPPKQNTELVLSDYANELFVCLFNPYHNFTIAYQYYKGPLVEAKSTIKKVSAEYIIKASRIAPSPTPTPTPTPEAIVTPGAFCSPAGAIGKSSSGVIYTCKTSPTDSRDRWRQ